MYLPTKALLFSKFFHVIIYSDLPKIPVTYVELILFIFILISSWIVSFSRWKNWGQKWLKLAWEYLANSCEVETRYQHFWPMVLDAFRLIVCLCSLDSRTILSWKGLIYICPLHNLLGSKTAVVELRMHCPTRAIMPMFYKPLRPFSKIYDWSTRVKYVTSKRNMHHRTIFPQKSFKEKSFKVK